MSTPLYTVSVRSKLMLTSCSDQPPAKELFSKFLRELATAKKPLVAMTNPPLEHYGATAMASPRFNAVDEMTLDLPATKKSACGFEVTLFTPASLVAHP